MTDIWTNAAGGDANAIQAIAALMSIAAAVGAAVTFIATRFYAVLTSRAESHRYVSELYRDYLAVCLEHPRLRLGYGRPADETGLSDDERVQRDVGFDLLTSMFEAAYATYASRTSSDRARQWRGWEDYVDHYVARRDYQDWWIRLTLGGTTDELFAAPQLGISITQFDSKFERFMMAKMREQLPPPDRPVRH